MGLLDFIKNRNQPSAEATAQPKQETAKQMYTREAGEDRAAMKPLDRLPEQPREQLDEIKSRMEKATAQPEPGAGSASPAPTDGASSPEPQRQNMASQETTSPDLSPTSMQAGRTASEKDTPAAPPDTPAAEKTPAPTPAPTPDPSPSRSPRGPGWER
jgi:hypothetical protein